MSCPICHRSSCIKSFHSLAAQERFDIKQEMSDNIDILREEILDLRSENEDLRRELAGEDL